MINRPLEIALVGSRGSGKSALCEQLYKIAAAESIAISLTEHHYSHEDMDCQKHDIVLQVVDATDLENSLSLTPHLIDHDCHIVLAINRYDLLLATEHSLDIAKFEELIGVPVCTVSATTGEGLHEVLQMLVEVAKEDESHAHPVFHGWEQEEIDAYKAYVHGVLMQTLRHAPDDQKKTPLEKIDKILTNKWIGFPILALVLSIVFRCTFALGDPIGELMQYGIDCLHDWLEATFADGWLRSLLANGIVEGVGSLLTSLPNIIILFFFLSLMEDSGYMARVAFLMDGVMHRIGLHGRSFIPMLMGFDCNVPAIMAARDIKDPKDRALTMLMVPFMSCSARLPVYILFISAFFAGHKAVVLMSLYLIGILCSFVFAFLMKKTKWFRKPNTDMVNELPAFKLPTWRSILGHIWYRVSDFLQKISTVVLCASIVIWALEYFPSQDLAHLETSWLASIGHFVEPIMRPLGFDWRMSVCLLTGLPAKEAIAATFAILFDGGIASTGINMITAYAFLVFTLLYFPCVATIATIRREVSWKWAVFTVVHSILLAWVMAFAVQLIGGIFMGA